MTSNIQELEERLATMTRRKRCVLTSRATAALYLTFQALDRSNGRIIFPATLCPSPAYAALYAGHSPLFCDIDPQTGNMDPVALEALLANSRDVVAIVAAHLYGQPPDMAALCFAAEQHDIPVIEDIAQGLGATMPDGTPSGSSGNCAILSFGHTKIIDAGYGGALVTDDEQLADRLHAAECNLATPDPACTNLAASYSKNYYRIRDAAESNLHANDDFFDFPVRYRALYLDRFTPSRANEILQALDGLDKTLAARRRKAAIYDEILYSTSITALHRDKGAAPWRYNVHLPSGDQKRLTDELRNSGFDASNWYPSLHRSFEATRHQNEAELSQALKHEGAILNLWLDDMTNDDRVAACAHRLANLLTESQSTMEKS